MNFLRRRLALQNKLVLDYGAGKGFLFEHLLNHGCRVKTLEFSNDGFSYLEERFSGRVNYIDTTKAEGLPTTLQDSSVDVVIIVEVIEQLLDSYFESTFSEVFRVLRPGGTLVVTTPNDEDLEKSLTCCPECMIYFHRMQHVRSFTEESLCRFLESKGFSDCRTETVNLAAFNDSSILNLLRRIKRKIGLGKQPHLVGFAQIK